jgi:hypothetical protein
MKLNASAVCPFPAGLGFRGVKLGKFPRSNWAGEHSTTGLPWRLHCYAINAEEPMINLFIYVAVATRAIWHTAILEAGNLQEHPFVGCEMPSGNTLFSQVTNHSSHTAGTSSVCAKARGLAGAVAVAVAVKTLGRTPNWIHRLTTVPDGLGITHVRDP